MSDWENVYDYAYEVECPECGSLVGQKCISLAKNPQNGDVRFTPHHMRIRNSKGREYQDAISQDRKKLVHQLNSYLDLARFSEESEGAEPNEQWLLGFQAAIAIVKGNSNE